MIIELSALRRRPRNDPPQTGRAPLGLVRGAAAVADDRKPATAVEAVHGSRGLQAPRHLRGRTRRAPAADRAQFFSCALVVDAPKVGVQLTRCLLKSRLPASGSGCQRFVARGVRLWIPPPRPLF